MENKETSELKDVVKKIREYSISHLEELQKIAIKKLQIMELKSSLLKTQKKP